MCIRDRIYGGTPVAKAKVWPVTDAHSRKRGEQIGLDTLVVHAAVSYTHLSLTEIECEDHFAPVVAKWQVTIVKDKTTKKIVVNTLRPTGTLKPVSYTHLVFYH